MNNILNILNKAVKNKILHFVFSGYVTYFIQFINSLFIAVYLGPYYLGIWGFVNLVVQCFSQVNFGIGLSANAIASIHKKSERYVRLVIGTSMTMFIILSIIVILLFLSVELFDLKFGGRYNFSHYALFVLLVIISSYFSGLLSVLFRVYGKIYEMVFSQTIYPIITLVTLFFFKGENLLMALVLSLCVSSAMSLILFLLRSPLKIHPLFIWRLMKKIQNKGWYLFIYNSSFYFIILSTRTFVSGYYTVTEFGYFTFAFSLANAILMLLESFSYLIYPKILNRFATESNERVLFIMTKLRDVYISSAHLLIHVAILFFPIFLLFFPKYSQASVAFNIIALTVVLYTNSFGYSGLLIAKGKEKNLGRIAFFSLAVNILTAFLLVMFVKVSYSYVALSTMVTYFLYVLLIGNLGRKCLNVRYDLLSVLKDILPIRLFIPYTISVMLTFMSVQKFYFIIPLVLFIVFNFKQLFDIKNEIKGILVNPNYANI